MAGSPDTLPTAVPAGRGLALLSARSGLPSSYKGGWRRAPRPDVPGFRTPQDPLAPRPVLRPDGLVQRRPRAALPAGVEVLALAEEARSAGRRLTATV